MSEEKTEGMKFDNGKSRVELIPGNVLLYLGEILAYGANKYAPNSWQNLEDFDNRYLGAALRHLYQHQSGEKFDKESGKTHLGHALTNVMFLLYKQLKEDEQLGK